jgi:hypothetical protein
MKNILKRLLAFLIILLILPSELVYADGSGNIDGGGGSLNQGVEGYLWPDIGYDGVRITVVDAQSGQRVSEPIDYTNKNVTAMSQNIYHFGKVSKVDYRSGAALSLQIINYQYKNPEIPIPQIISGNSKQASLPAIRQYFCSEAAAKMISNDTGILFSDIEAGKYKIVIEPVIYLIYQHLYFAMTTTEAGLYNRMLGGDLGAHFPTVVMKNLALAIFLQSDDLGFLAWHGPTGSARTTEEMISILGIGIVSYQGQPPTEITYDKQYRTDTEVITAVVLTANSQKTPESPAYARFSINGKTYSHSGIYIPKGGTQLAWVKWRTPKEPGVITITVTSNCLASSSEIVAQIVDLDKNPPPDPRANDRNDGFKIPSKPNNPSTTTLTWGEWDCWWHEHWVWHSGGEDEDGWWEDEGWYEYAWLSYSASLTAEMRTKPDEKVPTASGKVMKSGYGLNATVSAQVRSSAPSSHITGAQNVVAYFPEFQYKTYWRLLKRLTTGYSSTFEFQKNKYSTYGQPCHFSPVWFPDGRYTTYAEVLDMWTPAGMLQINLTDDLTIQDSLFSDWHIRPVK